MKKNTNIFVDFQKFLAWIRENKIIFILIIIFMLTFKWECGNKEGSVKWSLSCIPLRLSDVKEVIK